MSFLDEYGAVYYQSFKSTLGPYVLSVYVSTMLILLQGSEGALPLECSVLLCVTGFLYVNMQMYIIWIKIIWIWILLIDFLLPLSLPYFFPSFLLCSLSRFLHPFILPSVSYSPAHPLSISLSFSIPLFLPRPLPSPSPLSIPPSPFLSSIPPSPPSTQKILKEVDSSHRSVESWHGEAISEPRQSQKRSKIRLPNEATGQLAHSWSAGPKLITL